MLNYAEEEEHISACRVRISAGESNVELINYLRSVGLPDFHIAKILFKSLRREDKYMRLLAIQLLVEDIPRQ